MLTIAHGHQDQRRRRTRVQNVNTPFGSRERGSTAGRRYPLRGRRTVHAWGRLLARGRIGRLPLCVVVLTMYGSQLPRRRTANPRFSPNRTVGPRAGGASAAIAAAIGVRDRSIRLDPAHGQSVLRLASHLLSSRQLRSSGALPGDNHPTIPNGRQCLPDRHLENPRIILTATHAARHTRGEIRWRWSPPGTAVPGTANDSYGWP
jgi:hypothetical protein